MWGLLKNIVFPLDLALFLERFPLREGSVRRTEKGRQGSPSDVAIPALRAPHHASRPCDTAPVPRFPHFGLPSAPPRRTWPTQQKAVCWPVPVRPGVRACGPPLLGPGLLPSFCACAGGMSWGCGGHPGMEARSQGSQAQRKCFQPCLSSPWGWAGAVQNLSSSCICGVVHSLQESVCIPI